MDIYTLIHNDHEEARALMKQIRDIPDIRHQERMLLFYTLQADVIAHNESEEDSFYEALKQHPMTEGRARHNEREHHDVKVLMRELDDRGLKADIWREKFSRLSLMLEEHIDEEETSVFADARAILTQESAERLADIMARLKFMKKEFLKKAG